MRQNRVHLMPPMSNFYARICVKATPSSNNFFAYEKQSLALKQICTTFSRSFFFRLGYKSQ